VTVTGPTRTRAIAPLGSGLYLLLGRLRRDGLVTTTWHESPSGPPRRYYQLTTEGQRALALFTTEWDRFTDAVDRLLRQGGST
jgi:PadR family transcriptional regulator, regulatory protein PadR